MADKEKIHQILSLLWKNDDSVGKTYYNQALQDVQTAIDLQKEPVSIWHSIEELPTAREYEYILVIYKDITAPRIAGNKSQVFYWDRVDKWAYLEDVLNLSNVKKGWKEGVRGSYKTMTE